MHTYSLSEKKGILHHLHLKTIVENHTHIRGQCTFVCTIRALCFPVHQTKASNEFLPTVMMDQILALPSVDTMYEEMLSLSRHRHANLTVRERAGDILNWMHSRGEIRDGF